MFCKIFNCGMNCPRLVSKYRTPKLIWYQTDVTVVLRILLQDVENYFLRVECDHLLFSTLINSRNYCICLYLFGTVVAERTSHKNLGREIRITLAKAHKWTEWLRLHVEREKNPLISLDPDNIYKRDWIMDSFKNAEKESFTEYKRRHNITQIMPDVPSTDEEKSDDDLTDILLL